MPESSNIDSHPLLNYEDFKDKAFEAGYDKAMGARVFSAIARGAFTLLTPDRNAHSIAYSEENRDGKVEVVISVPNLARNLHRLESVPQMGEISIETAAGIVDATMQP